MCTVTHKSNFCELANPSNLSIFMCADSLAKQKITFAAIVCVALLCSLMFLKWQVSFF